MSITIPSEITWLFPIVVGESWPEGDEDKLRALGEAWRAASADIDEVITQAGNAATTSFGAMEGQAADAFQEYWKKFVEGADAYLVKLKESCDGLAGTCDNTALEVEYAKYAIIAALIMLAIEIAALIAAAFGTFGTSTAGIPIAQAATRITVQMIFRKLITAILREVLTEVAIDAAIQGIQIAKGDRKSWDWSKTGGAALSGAISGAIGGGMDFIPTKATGLGGNIVEGAVRGGVEGVASTVANAAITGQDITAGDLARSGVSGGVSGGIGGAKSHYDTPTAPNIGDGPGAPPPPGGPPGAPPGGPSSVLPEWALRWTVRRPIGAARGPLERSGEYRHALRDQCRGRRSACSARSPRADIAVPLRLPCLRRTRAVRGWRDAHGWRSVRRRAEREPGRRQPVEWQPVEWQSVEWRRATGRVRADESERLRRSGAGRHRGRRTRTRHAQCSGKPPLVRWSRHERARKPRFECAGRPWRQHSWRTR